MLVAHPPRSLQAVAHFKSVKISLHPQFWVTVEMVMQSTVKQSLMTGQALPRLSVTVEQVLGLGGGVMTEEDEEEVDVLQGRRLVR